MDPCGAKSGKESKSALQPPFSLPISFFSLKKKNSLNINCLAESWRSAYLFIRLQKKSTHNPFLFAFRLPALISISVLFIRSPPPSSSPMEHIGLYFISKGKKAFFFFFRWCGCVNWYWSSNIWFLMLHYSHPWRFIAHVRFRFQAPEFSLMFSHYNSICAFQSVYPFLLGTLCRLHDLSKCSYWSSFKWGYQP